MCVGIAQGNAQTSSYGELQAAYMYNFAKYITWPGEGDRFIIGVYLEADIMSDLERILIGKKVRGKAIELKRVESVDDLLSCHIIYLSGANSENLELVTASLGSKSVLLVTEDDLVRKGATISFVVQDEKLRFKIKRALLEKSGLVASEGLLKLAIMM
jgi:hypothetical protein